MSISSNSYTPPYTYMHVQLCLSLTDLPPHTEPNLYVIHADPSPRLAWHYQRIAYRWRGSYLFRTSRNSDNTKVRAWQPCNKHNYQPNSFQQTLLTISQLDTARQFGEITHPASTGSLATKTNIVPNSQSSPKSVPRWGARGNSCRKCTVKQSKIFANTHSVDLDQGWQRYKQIRKLCCLCYERWTEWRSSYCSYHWSAGLHIWSASALQHTEWRISKSRQVRLV